MPETNSTSNFQLVTTGNRKAIIAAIVITLLILTLLFALKIFQTKETVPIIPQPPSSTTRVPTVAAKPVTSLALVPAQKTINVGENVPLAVSISGESIQAADIVLLYDPQIFLAESITEGNAFPKFIRKSIENGKIIVSVAVDPQAAQKLSNSGTLFTVNFRALGQSDSASIVFDPQETILARGGANYLNVALGGTYKVQ